jgi:site-specific recombinase XerD
VAAYIIGARPKTKHRRLFLNLQPPYRPMTPNAVGCRITFAMKRAGLDTSAYWLRHTYAQNLLEAGASIFEIKEMLGHDTIESTHRYLHVHTKLMRQVVLSTPLLMVFRAIIFCLYGLINTSGLTPIACRNSS